MSYRSRETFSFYNMYTNTAKKKAIYKFTSPFAGGRGRELIKTEVGPRGPCNSSQKLSRKFADFELMTAGLNEG